MYVQLNYFAVQQKLTDYYKSTIFQLKKNLFYTRDRGEIVGKLSNDNSERNVEKKHFVKLDKFIYLHLSLNCIILLKEYVNILLLFWCLADILIFKWKQL